MLVKIVECRKASKLYSVFSKHGMFFRALDIAIFYKASIFYL